MLGALERHCPPGVRWTKPQGGLFLWITLPVGLDSTQLLKEALEEEKVAFVPGSSLSRSQRKSSTRRSPWTSLVSRMAFATGGCAAAARGVSLIRP